MEFKLNAKRPWRFISALMAHGWRLEDTTEVNRGFFQLVKFDAFGGCRQAIVNANGSPTVQLIPSRQWNEL